jgi:hypothetical protein
VDDGRRRHLIATSSPRNEDGGMKTFCPLATNDLGGGRPSDLHDVVVGLMTEPLKKAAPTT